MIRFDLDRLAVPLRGKGGGKTTSDLVTILSNMEFADEDVVIVCHSRATMDFHVDMAVTIGLQMGFNVQRVAAHTLEIDRNNRIYWEAPGRTFRQRKQHALYLSSTTHEIVSEKDFYILDGKTHL